MISTSIIEYCNTRHEELRKEYEYFKCPDIDQSTAPSFNLNVRFRNEMKLEGKIEMLEELMNRMQIKYEPIIQE